MRKSTFLTTAILGSLLTFSARSQDYPIQPVPFTNVKITSAFWQPRIETNRTQTIPFAFQKCEETGRIDNFAIAGKLKKGEFQGQRFDDSDVFKVVEGASYSLASHPDPKLEAYLDTVITKIAAAQEPDGYLYTIRTILGDKIMDRDWRSGYTRFNFLNGSHELYNVGHLYEAAVAHYQATGKKTLLNVATKNADYLLKVFGPEKLIEVPGHEEIELGLVKLYRATKKKEYLDLAKFFIDMRGRKDLRRILIVQQPDGSASHADSLYFQDHIPVTEQTEVVGHSVRAGYLYAGMTDVDAVMGAKTYGKALNKLWHNAVDQRMFLTGGVGANRTNEGFGEDYELPNQEAYAETCASVAQMLWNYRMFLESGDAAYLDVFERIMYNGFLSGVSLDGTHFFYPNPLAADGVTKFNGEATRVEWFATSCCPTNVTRVMPSLPGYVYAVRNNDLYLNLFMAGTANLTLNNQPITVTQETNYPWNGFQKLTLMPEKTTDFTVRIRIPGWAQGKPMPGDLYRYQNAEAQPITIKVNGKKAAYRLEKGFAVLQRTWKKGDVVEMELPMPIRKVLAHEKVKADQGRVALERGPIVYCVEGVDNGGEVEQISVNEQTKLKAINAPDFITTSVLIKGENPGGAKFTAIPYHLWSHRGVGKMAVWLHNR
ncbi:six-hairpin glycosidase [Siphonobacter sp. BAB-5405]|uniref:glycoside hydrolase family 127 protein n=1 Tax=Siphonobacter sp. BAB-5405 TaxID=1864825 RepID=UPI000C80B710|nr:glycoside hydrolase family 127 protein [Siphonobacter sp. BAB-5405]PMD96621.1 six-hairpin glycosidase [Siphonobacter sp. BAB-5405]